MILIAATCSHKVYPPTQHYNGFHRHRMLIKLDWKRYEQDYLILEHRPSANKRNGVQYAAHSYEYMYTFSCNNHHTDTEQLVKTQTIHYKPCWNRHQSLHASDCSTQKHQTTGSDVETHIMHYIIKPCQSHCHSIWYCHQYATLKKSG